jgi:hypothetical protein
VSVGTVESYSRRVSRGARLLDSRAPGWWRWVNTQRLDTSSVRDCVLGQLVRARAVHPWPPYTEWENTLNAIGITGATSPDYGFDARPTQFYARNCLKLDGLWRREISERASRANRTRTARGA